MPPKQRITRQMIIEAGYEIARRDGIEHINSRSISKLLSCSTQPVFSCFTTMEELKITVFEHARERFIEDGITYVNTDNHTDFLGLSIKWYLMLLRDEPNLYRLLYFSGGSGSHTPKDFIAGYTSSHLVLEKMQALYQLDLKECRDILLRANALLHGIGSLVFFNGFDMSNEDITDMVKRTVSEMVRSGQRKEI